MVKIVELGDAGGAEIFEIGADTLVNQTIAPKGNAPHQATLLEAQRGNMQQLLGAMAEQQSRKPKYGAGEAAFYEGSLNFVDNMLALPSAAADVVSYPVRRAMNSGYVPGVQGERTPVFGATPRMTFEGLMGIDPSFREEMQAQRPIATAIGGLGGDVASLMTGKLPLTKVARKLETRAAEGIEKAEDLADYGSKIAKTAAEARKKKFWSKPVGRKVKRWAGRVAEAGGEGAALAIMKGEDPLTMAAWTGGAQAGLGAMSGVATHNYLGSKLLGNRKLANLAANVAILTSTLGAVAYLTPGDQKYDKDYYAEDGAFGKVLGGAAIGFAAGIFSGRARTGKWARLKPKLTEAVTSVPRHTMQAGLARFVQESTPEERAAVQAKLKQIDPTDKDAADAWAKASKSPEGIYNWLKGF